MHDTASLIEKAEALGAALAGNGVVQAYFAAQRAVRADKTAQELLSAYQSQLARLRELEAAQKPIEVADKQKLRDLETSMAGHEGLKALMRAQTDYVDLMNRVNQAMDTPLAALARQEPAT
ncbi:MAG: YlbF family regulator [Phycisphaerales bacterium]|nr:YlbF family regulator [Phycisphaerales bacterium]